MAEMNRLAKSVALAIGAAALLGTVTPARANDTPGSVLQPAHVVKKMKENNAGGFRLSVGGFFETADNELLADSLDFTGITGGVAFYAPNGLYAQVQYHYGLDGDSIGVADIDSRSYLATVGLQKALDDRTTFGIWGGFAEHRFDVDFPGGSMDFAVRGPAIGAAIHHTFGGRGDEPGRFSVYAGMRFFPADWESDDFSDVGVRADNRFQAGGGIQYRFGRQQNLAADVGVTYTRISFTGVAFAFGKNGSVDSDVDDVKVQFTLHYTFGKGFK
jgi:hypothetical protein